MSGTGDGGDGNGQSASGAVVSRRGVLRRTAMGVGGSLIAGRVVRRADAETVGAGSTQETASRLRWEQTYRGDEGDHGFLDSCGTADGGAVLAGVTAQGRQTGVPWAVKVDADGNEGWNRTYTKGDAAAEYLLGAIPAHDGGTVLVGGRAHEFGNQDTDERGDRDVVVRKIDDDGAVQWEETHGGTDIDWAYGGVALQDSGYLFYGYTYSYTDADKHDLWARKVDNGGSKVWDSTVGSDPAFFANDAVETDDGGALLAGGRWYGRGSETDHLVVKLDRNGAVAWRRTHGSAGRNSSAFAIVRRDEGYAFVGDDGEDTVLYGLDTAGSVVWTVTLGTGISPGALYAVGDGRFLVGGARAVDDTGRRWLAEVGAQRTITWEQTYGEGDVGTLTAVDGGTLATGNTSSAGWAGAIAESDEPTDTDGKSEDSTPTDDGDEVATTDSEESESTTDGGDGGSTTDGNTDASGPGFGPLAALSGIGIGAYRLYAGSNNE